MADMAMKTAEEYAIDVTDSLDWEYNSGADLEMLRDAIAVKISEAQRDALEAAAKAACAFCCAPSPIWQTASKWGNTWQHLPIRSDNEPRRCAVECAAHAIHDLKADLEPTP